MLSLCRIEPENNAHLILEAFSLVPDATLVFVGNWNINPYGKRLYERYNSKENIRLYHPIYNQAQLFTIRSQATAYVHGHSAGGTNPSLVEMMHFDLPVLTYNCAYNRFTTEDKALYFSSVDDLVSLIKRVQYADCSHIGHNMREIALRRYTWNIIGRTYFDLLMST
jgi:glycosyltransferase involved in cell wall biosynthesis